MNRFIICKNKGTDRFHAEFIIKEADVTAALCMDKNNKKQLTPVT